MRLSTNSNDPGYKAWRAMRRYGVAPVVTVNGVPARECITVDTKRGIAVVADLDDQGKLQLNSKHDAVKHKVLAGRVAIAFVSEMR